MSFLPKISLVASAARPAFWQRFYHSLLGNEVPFEVIFVGPNAPDFELPHNFYFVPTNVKPAQCYEIGLRAAKGLLVGWTADDADYNHPNLNCPNALDRIWNHYMQVDATTILAMRTIEDGNDVSESHHLFFDDRATPRMAPLGFINRSWLMSLGGYDRNFICGQSENDVVMRALADGGTVELVNDAKVYLHHAQCHGVYSFRQGYNTDREFLESCWINEGYGTYENKLPYTISPVRLKEFQPFTEYELLNVNQGPAGRWEEAKV